MNKNIFLIILVVSVMVISGCTKVVEEGPETTGEVMKVGRDYWPGNHCLSTS